LELALRKWTHRNVLLDLDVAFSGDLIVMATTLLVLVWVILLKVWVMRVSVVVKGLLLGGSLATTEQVEHTVEKLLL